MSYIIQTARTALRAFRKEDAVFLLSLMNTPGWLNYIGNTSVKTEEDAQKTIQNKHIPMQEKHGFSLFVVELKENSEPIGICGLLRREGMEDVELGFAFLEAYCQKGFGYETAKAVVDYGTETLQLSLLAALISQDNIASKNLVLKLGFTFAKEVQLSEYKPLHLYQYKAK